MNAEFYMNTYGPANKDSVGNIGMKSTTNGTHFMKEMAQVFFHQKRFMKSLRHTHMDMCEGRFIYVDKGIH